MKIPVSKLAGSAAKAEEFVRMQLLELYGAIGLAWTEEHPSIQEFILHFRPRQNSFTNIVRTAELLEILQFAREHGVGMGEVFRYTFLFQDHFPGRNALSVDTCVARAIEYRCPKFYLRDLSSMIAVARNPFFHPEHTTSVQRVVADICFACAALPWPDFFAKWEAFVAERIGSESGFTIEDSISYPERMLRRHELLGHIYYTPLFRQCFESSALDNIQRLHDLLKRSHAVLEPLS